VEKDRGGEKVAKFLDVAADLLQKSFPRKATKADYAARRGFFFAETFPLSQHQSVLVEQTESTAKKKKKRKILLMAARLLSFRRRCVCRSASQSPRPTDIKLLLV
jgi:hypothetical protein